VVAKVFWAIFRSCKGFLSIFVVTIVFGPFIEVGRWLLGCSESFVDDEDCYAMKTVMVF